MIRRLVSRSHRRAVTWENHVSDALDLFDPQPDGCPLCKEPETFDSMFLRDNGIEAS